MGVYHRADQELGDTFVILNPSKPFCHRLKRAHSTSPIPHAWDIHILALTAAMENWRWYITYMEENYESVVSITAPPTRNLLKACRK